MNILLIIIGIIAVLWILGKVMSASQDIKIIEQTPNHPSRLSKEIYPVGSGSCYSRSGDRHIWDYGSYDESFGPLDRRCKYCGEKEYKLITQNEWKSSFQL